MASTPEDQQPEPGQRRAARSDVNPLDQYPELAGWVAEDRRDVDRVGAMVAAWVLAWRTRAASGPTWYAIAAHVRPEMETAVPDAARRWYASQLVTMLADRGWLSVPDAPTGAGYLELGPRVQGRPQERRAARRGASDAAEQLALDIEVPDGRLDAPDCSTDWTVDPLF